MRKKLSEGLALSVLLLVICFFISCQENSDDDSDDDDAIEDDDDTTDDDDTVDDDGDDDYTDPDCVDDIVPELISVGAIVNGEPVDFPFTAYDTDEIIFSFEYDDPDCNLIVDGEGGAIEFREDGIYIIGLLPTDSPCSTVDTGNPVDVVLDLVNRVGYGEHHGWIALSDKCGRGNELYLEFNIPFTG